MPNSNGNILSVTPNGQRNLDPSWWQSLLGVGGAPRYQLWPERLAREALGAPHAAMTGEYGLPGTPEFQERAIPPAQAVAAFAGAGAMPAAEEGSLGIFGGRLAQGAPLDKLELAKGLDKHGTHPQDIWQLSGWSKGKSGDWSFELPDDENYKFNPDKFDLRGLADHNAATGDTLAIPLPALINHPKLFEAYPHLNDFFVQPVRGNGSWASSPYKQIGLGVDGLDWTNNPASSLLHEVNHAVQHYEGFPGGANLMTIAHRTLSELDERAKVAYDKGDKAALSEIGDLVTRLTHRMYRPESPPSWDSVVTGDPAQPLRSKMYNREVGEVASRNVQKRFTQPSLRAVAPQLTEEIARERQLLYRRGPFGNLLPWAGGDAPGERY